MKKGYILFAILTLLVCKVHAQPVTAAPAPTANASNVLSLFGSHYKQIPQAAGTSTWLQNWGQKAQATYSMIGSDTTIEYSPLDYAGVQFASAINVSTYDSLHLDIWTPSLTGIFLDLIATNENSDTIVLVPNQWNSITIPLSVYTVNAHKLGAPNAPCDLSKLLQFNFIANNAGVTPQGTSGAIYLENIYFVQKAGKPSLGTFTVPAELVGASPFTLTPPTSTSTGTFTYTSSNTSVATISGSTVTILGAGSSLITATQAAAGGYSSASTSATLVVSYPPPASAAPVPTTPSADVISLFSDSYTNITGVNFYTHWGGQNVVSYDSIQGNNTMVYNNFDFEGIQLTGNLDVSKYNFLHIDIYTPDCASLGLNLINTVGSTLQVIDTLKPKLNQWTSFDIPLSKFSPINLSEINQLMFNLGSGSNTVYLDNLYFWANSGSGTPPTITNFTVPSETVGAAPFTLTAPTSNSPGAFTYSSSDATVATISGNTVTIVGAGTTIITATQAAASSYSGGSISSNLVVSYPSPTTAAPTPTQNPANVVSLWGNTYSNIAAGINWFPNWGQSTQLNLLNIGGDTTLEYSSLNYEGVQFTDSINVSKADSIHLDIWTPNCTSIGINLINSALVTGGKAIQVADTVTLTKAGWNSINLPVSAFKGVELNQIDQVMFTGVAPATGGVIYLQNIYFWGSELLAVNIANLNALKNGNTAVVSWETLSEKNSKGFEIERSNDGTNWTSLQFVNGKGNTVSVNNYSVVDNTPSKGINYYRLAETDLTGKITYSAVVSVDFSNAALGFSFYPNPVKDVLTVSLQTIQSHSASLSLTSIDGKTVKTIQLSNGNPNSSVSFNVSGIAKGIYLLTLRDGNTIKTSKVLIN